MGNLRQEFSAPASSGAVLLTHVLTCLGSDAMMPKASRHSISSMARKSSVAEPLYATSSVASTLVSVMFCKPGDGDEANGIFAVRLIGRSDVAIESILCSGNSMTRKRPVTTIAIVMVCYGSYLCYPD